MTTDKPIDRQLIFDMYAGHCAYCGCEIEFNKFNVEHVIPKARWHCYGRQGGPNQISNLKPACSTCNHHKSTYLLEDFRAEVGKQIERALKYSAPFRMAVKYGLVEIVDKPIVFYFETINSSTLDAEPEKENGDE